MRAAEAAKLEFEGPPGDAEVPCQITHAQRPGQAGLTIGRDRFHQTRALARTQGVAPFNTRRRNFDAAGSWLSTRAHRFSEDFAGAAADFLTVQGDMRHAAVRRSSIRQIPQNHPRLSRRGQHTGLFKKGEQVRKLSTEGAEDARARLQALEKGPVSPFLFGQDVGKTFARARRSHVRKVAADPVTLRLHHFVEPLQAQQSRAMGTADSTELAIARLQKCPRRHPPDLPVVVHQQRESLRV